MVAQAIFIKNFNEIRDIIEQNERYSLNKEIPEQEIETDEFHFSPRHVSYFYKNVDGNINAMIGGKLWTLAYDKALWDELSKKID